MFGFIFVCHFGLCQNKQSSDMSTPTNRSEKDHDKRSWEEYFIQLAEMEDFENADWEDAYEILCNLQQNPININTATREELEQIPFLSSTEVEAIMEYLNRYGEMKSLGELAMIHQIDYVERRLLECFLYVGDKLQAAAPVLSKMFRYATHDLLFTARIPMYERKGDKEGYLGYPYRHDIRYSMHYGQKMKIGIVGAQDAGEPFFANKNKWGYDFYSFYLLLQDMGKWKTLVLGRYRVTTGLGLVMNTNFTLGKSTVLQSIGRGGHAIRAHSSRSSANYLQGIAATRNLTKQLELTSFMSYRSIDATLSKDSIYAATIVTSGYHRTQTELDKKNNTHQWLAGLNLNWSSYGLYVGATTAFSGLDRELKPDTSQLYRQIYPKGKTFGNASVNYGYTNGWLSVKGETAIKFNNSNGIPLATINTIAYKPVDELEFTVLQRFYSYHYSSLFARSFSEGGRVQNESGVYLGVKWCPQRSILFSAYTDYAYFAWPRYQVSQASHVWDNFLSFNYSTNKWNFLVRYRFKMSERDNEENILAYRKEHRAQVSIMHETDRWSFKSQANTVYYSFEDKHRLGWLVSQCATYYPSKRWNVHALVSYFHTDDYNSRIYAYERGMLYNFSFPTYYGEGIRYSLIMHLEISDHLTTNAKVGITNYFDRSTIGTGYQLINHSSMTDIDIQLKWKF